MKFMQAIEEMLSAILAANDLDTIQKEMGTRGGSRPWCVRLMLVAARASLTARMWTCVCVSACF